MNPHIMLETSRLCLREFKANEARLLYQLDSSPEVMKYIGPVKTFEDCELRLQRELNYYRQHEGYGIWAAVQKIDQQFIGWACLKHLDNTDEIEVGYRLLKSYWRQGFATELAQALLCYGFEQLGLDHIVGITRPENLASARVLTKVGMLFEKQAYFYKTKVNYFTISKKQLNHSFSKLPQR